MAPERRSEKDFSGQSRSAWSSRSIISHNVLIKGVWKANSSPEAVYLLFEYAIVNIKLTMGELAFKNPSISTLCEIQEVSRCRANRNNQASQVGNPHLAFLFPSVRFFPFR